MTSRIQQLDSHVVNRIAAGEVIERPASVVKELLENSIDALATRVEIDVAAGGMDMIRICDNGEGMHPEDLLLAVTSHATSKIRSDADLQQIATLGFRGEALASIASVSRFRIRTRREDSPVGRELEADGGSVTVHRDCGCAQGTTIEVRNLFFNTPARRKFLKKASTEFGQIGEQFTRIALACPCLHLVLRHSDRLVYELPATTDQRERIRRFFGSDLADKLIAVESSTTTESGETIRVWGFVGDPSLSKATRKNQYLFLNGRCIQDRSLQHALNEAYRGLLMVGRHPVSFLFLELPPHLVDVNVHPTKTEVRFRDSQALYRQLLHTLRDRFLSMNFQAEFSVPAPQMRHAVGAGQVAVATNPQRELNIWSASAARPDVRVHAPEPAPFERRDHNSAAAVSDQDHSDAIPPTREDSSVSSATSEAKSERGPQPPAPVETSQQAAVSAASGSFTAGEFRAFQIHDCYLVVAGDAGLEVIDQHALHERILYEHLRIRVLEGGVERQKLLIPEPIECSAGEAAVLLEYQELLKEAGFELEEFGGTTVLLTAHPVLLPRGNFVNILRDLAEQLESTDGKTSRRDLLDHMLHTMACRAAIKAGQRLAPEEMQELLKQRHLVDDAHHCPHGRPTSLTLSRMTLDKQFGRLG
ncbi:MAG: DNA mismatch repair endonuclease MutL [Planctomycetaceae bacterium]